MKPLNTEERKKSFGVFLLFFIITTAVVVGAVYFGVEVPFAQNDRLKNQVSRYQRQQSFADAFGQKMAETKRLLDSVNKSGVQATIIDGQITESIKQMNAMVDGDSSGNKQLYHDMVQSFVDLQFAKQGLRNASGNEANLANSAQELAQLKSELSACQMQNAMLRNTGGGQQQQPVQQRTPQTQQQ